MFVVGLTGGIGSGKSAVAGFFRELGIKVVDADQIARLVVEPGTEALRQIADHFGADILLEDGSLNRAELREIIFSNPLEKQWLESLLHPLIREALWQELNSAEGPYVVLESPLLLELGQNRDVNSVLVVDVPEEIQVQRASKRDNNSEAQIRAIIASQMTREERLKLADDVVDNSDDLKKSRKQLEAHHNHYLTLSKKITPN